MKELKFPKNFIWGVSTSAYQIEGGTNCDWTLWEKSEARRKSLRERGLDPNDFLCGNACDSYNRYSEDLDLIKDLNCGAYRFGIEWARIEPEKGFWNKNEIEHYKAVLKEAKQKGITTFVTLWHWTNPAWLVKEDGWKNKNSVKYFERYVEKIAEEMGEYVDYWVTVNEPLMIFAHGYWDGKFPPSHKRDLMGGIKVARNLIKAHKAAYHKIHQKIKSARVGLAMTSGYFDRAHKYNLLEMIIVKIANYLRNLWFINRVVKEIDYMGVNYYHHDRIVWYPPFKKNENIEVSDFGWEIFPEGIYHVVKGYQKYKKPIYILENGIADAKDEKRAKFIKEHLAYLHKAIEEGVDVRGYFHWSLLDNFEWADGYTMKFGLYSVDRKTFERKPRNSAHVYAKICLENKVKLDD